MVTATQKASILVVDDEAIIRKTLSRKLMKEGYLCTEAGSADEAKARLEERAPELAILDIKMPGKPGNELLSEIKQSHPETAVIMATALTDIDIVIQCMKEGAHDYIIKPFDFDKVMISIDRTLRMRDLELDIKRYQQHLEQEVKDQTQEIRRIFLGAIESLVFALEAKDPYTGGHSRRVTDIALAIGQRLDLPTDMLDDLRWGALLHDVGKIAVDSAIQNKPGNLTPEEYGHVMTHALVGPRIVKPVANERVLEIITHHHARYDGNGLNQGVVGEDIPLGARILAVADTYDAMTSDRPYRDAMHPDNVISEIAKCAGTQFDPAVVGAFLKVPTIEIMPK
ncbi:MAG: response regulator [Dehalococcoidales bacterium]|nr:MAG: response regulator [Dehalococcoidales bacterium]